MAGSNWRQAFEPQYPHESLVFILTLVADFLRNTGRLPNADELRALMMKPSC